MFSGRRAREERGERIRGRVFWGLMVVEEEEGERSRVR
jgi:hypothetical protein